MAGGEGEALCRGAAPISRAGLGDALIVKNLASFNDQNKKVESSAEIYRDQSLV